MTVLSTVAPRIGRAHAQMAELERVLGWLRDNSWTGGIDVLVDARPYGGGPLTWVSVDRIVQGDASPYPIRGPQPSAARGVTPGQWAFYEVHGLRFWADDFPELVEMHSQYPIPDGLVEWPLATPTLKEDITR